MKISRSFTSMDQQHFAAMSGDYNPIHVDAEKARRTQAGAQVVHGLNLLLSSLEGLANTHFRGRNMSSIRAQFMKFVYLDEPVTMTCDERDEAEIEIHVSANGVLRSSFIIGFGELAPLTDEGPLGVPVQLTTGQQALDVAIEKMAGQTGHFPLESKLASARDMYPALCDWVTAERVAALGATTRLVGMVYPGLNSVFSGLSIRFRDDPHSSALAFRVKSVHARFRTLDHFVWGSGIVGSLFTLVRRPPTPQMNYEQIREIIQPGEFADATALVVGGSRGLGELTAKIIAAGGGKVVITYNVGEADARSVAEQIHAHAGKCDIVQFDASLPPTQQIVDLASDITHAYYFATSAIFRPQAKTYNRDRFDKFVSIYIDGFFNLCEILAASATPKSIFYPSTIFVMNRPRGMTEYVMVKAAGEILSEEIRTAMPTLRLLAQRLPRVLTDQTASIVPVTTVLALDAILPVIRKLQGDEWSDDVTPVFSSSRS